jgi:hypothetical protein
LIEAGMKALDRKEWISGFVEAMILVRQLGENIVYLGSDGMPIVSDEDPEASKS